MPIYPIKSYHKARCDYLHIKKTSCHNKQIISERNIRSLRSDCLNHLHQIFYFINGLLRAQNLTKFALVLSDNWRKKWLAFAKLSLVLLNNCQEETLVWKGKISETKLVLPRLLVVSVDLTGPISSPAPLECSMQNCIQCFLKLWTLHQYICPRAKFLIFNCNYTIF